MVSPSLPSSSWIRRRLSRPATDGSANIVAAEATIRTLDAAFDPSTSCDDNLASSLNNRNPEGCAYTKVQRAACATSVFVVPYFLFASPLPRAFAILAWMQPDQQVISAWRASAPFWEKHREIIRQMFAPVTQALAEDGSIGRGNTVLDIASGPGEPALTIAALVGSEGKVFGIDPAPEMVDAARRAAGYLGFRNAQFEVASADRLPFPADIFDAVVSRFGVMFFPSPVDGVREMLRVLKPGRKLALAVWHFAENNPFHYSLARVIERFVDSPPPPPDAPDAFRFASPGKLLVVLAEAGAMSPSERRLQFTIEASSSVEDFWILRREMSEKLREKLATLSGEQLTEVKRQALEALNQYSTARGMSFPAEVLIVTGTKSRQA